MKKKKYQGYFEKSRGSESLRDMLNKNKKKKKKKKTETKSRRQPGNLTRFYNQSWEKGVIFWVKC
ncbi:hypothetical protein QQP08_014408 [Theobroma cacao]|nr:hypothetical protein QQP08_014408 [Theobroma cacao]